MTSSSRSFHLLNISLRPQYSLFTYERFLSEYIVHIFKLIGKTHLLLSENTNQESNYITYPVMASISL